MSPHTGKRDRDVFVPLSADGGRVGTAGGLPVVLKDFTLTASTESTTDWVIGVIDTGIVKDGDGNSHPFLAPHLVHPVEPDLIPDGENEEFRGHGTFVAGIIAQQAPTARIRMVAALTAEPDDVRVARAIDTLAEDSRVRLINLSFGGHGWELGVPPNLADALRRLDTGIVVVAAAGNDSLERKTYPAALAESNGQVISVGAADDTGSGPLVAEFSNHGKWVSAYAPGVGLKSTYLADKWAAWSGSSFAAAVVTGRIARAMAADPAGSARDAANEILREATLPVWGVNGPLDQPYVARVRP